MKNCIYIAYSSDDRYATHMGISIISLLENNKSFDEIIIFILDNNISNINIQNINSIIEKYRRKVIYINVEKQLNNMVINNKSKISISAYSRLFLSNLVPCDVNKIIYLDCDTIISDSLKDLWDIDIHEISVSGVIDTVSEYTKLKVNLDTSSLYINSGVLLINLKYWRENEIENRFLEYIRLSNGNVFHHDQGIINHVLNTTCKYIHPKYNAMTVFFTMKYKTILKYYKMNNYYKKSEVEEAILKPVIIHYTPAFAGRPWIAHCKHPLKNRYMYYKSLSPWSNVILEKNKSKYYERIISWLYNNLPFIFANTINKLLNNILSIIIRKGS